MASLLFTTLICIARHCFLVPYKSVIASHIAGRRQRSPYFCMRWLAGVQVLQQKVWNKFVYESNWVQIFEDQHLPSQVLKEKRLFCSLCCLLHCISHCVLHCMLHCIIESYSYVAVFYSQMTTQEKMKKRMQMMLNKQCESLHCYCTGVQLFCC